MTNKNLFLIVTKEWYDKIASGEKRVEYRESNSYWYNRLFINNTLTQKNKTIEFQCGYSRKYPRLKFKIQDIKLIATPNSVNNTVKTKYCWKIYFTDFWQPVIGLSLLPRITIDVSKIKIN